MRRGFIFSHNICVNCNACNAACILENGWNVHARNIYTYNSSAETILPVINLSLACNHCESAVCMDGCPTSALSRDEITGAIVINGEKCIGCRYCQWNCPYDAPKFDTESKTILKCNLCYSELINGGSPACSTACPTGALSYGILTGPHSTSYSWFPDKKLNPAIEFASEKNDNSLRIIPSGTFEHVDPETDPETKTVVPEMSLIIFSFLSTFSVATLISSFIEGKYPEKMTFIPVLVLTGLVSLFHLGHKVRSWRSISNFRTSPLSREIISFITYMILSFSATFLRIPFLLVISSVAGLAFMIMIDSVYIFSDKRKSVFFHSGQTFISALLMISFFAGSLLPFIFIALIKLVSSIYSLVNKPVRYFFNLRFFRIALLFITVMSMILSNLPKSFSVLFIFMVGELFDRILFYIDFNPLNINTLIQKQINYVKDEKKRS